MAISLTPAAADHVRKMLQQRGHGIGLRIGTRTAGCSGFAYTVDFADTIEADDRAYQSHGISVVVKNAQLSELEGTEIDFITGNVLNSGFEFHNPNVKSQCGCGESFSVS